MNSVLCVVVTYNRLNMLKVCVERVLSQSMPCDVFIVDNASTDGTDAWGKELSEKLASSKNIKLYYECMKENLGGAGGFNYGIKKSVQLGYEYVWVMDDDTAAEADTLEKLMAAAREIKQFGFLSSIVLWKDNSICKMNWQRKLKLPRNRKEHHITENDLIPGAIIPIQSATFVSLVFPTKVIKKVGLPIKEFFIWCDDIEFTRRIAVKNSIPGYAIVDSHVIHNIANNIGTDIATDDFSRIERYNYAFRNENFMYREYGIRGFLYYTAVCLFNTFKILKKSKNYRSKRLYVILKNYFTGLFFNPVIEEIQ